jgi:hypothetical protein
MPSVNCISYSELIRLREKLARFEPVDWQQLRLFAQSMVAPGDIVLMRRTVRDSPNDQIASDAILALFTRGGVGNVSGDVRGWFERGDDFNAMFYEGPTVLAWTCKDLFDGSALRSLFEFSGIPDVMKELTQLLADIGREYACSLLVKSREEQVDMCLGSFRESPSTRMLWRLRTYVDHGPVRALLREWISRGQIRALESLFFHKECVDWSLFDSIVGESDDDQRVLVNLTIENILRGAEFHGIEVTDTFRRFPDAFRMELYDGLRVVDKL